MKYRLTPTGQAGFTLIELMIVVAIIGVLAAIAIPQYQNYIARTQVTRVVSELSALKTPVEESLMRGDFPSNAADLGFTSSNLIDGNTPTVTFNSSDNGKGKIEATLGGNASSAVKGAKVKLTRAADGTWTCYVDGSNAGSWKSSYVPAGCTEGSGS